MLTNLWVSNVGCAQLGHLVYIPSAVGSVHLCHWALTTMARLAGSLFICSFTLQGFIHIVKEESTATWNDKSQYSSTFQTIACIMWPISHEPKQVVCPNLQCETELHKGMGSRRCDSLGATSVVNVPYHAFLKRFYLFFREWKGERTRGRETSMCGCLSHAPYWGPGPQPRHVP